MPSVFIKTYGCQMNERDSEAVAAQLVERGYSLASGQTLQGIGTVSGAMTVASGATLSPGNSPGNLNTGALTFASGGNYNWQILNATGTAGTDWDLITVGGTLNITATSGSKFNLNLWSLSSIGPDVNGNVNGFNNPERRD